MSDAAAIRTKSPNNAMDATVNRRASAHKGRWLLLPGGLEGGAQLVRGEVLRAGAPQLGTPLTGVLLSDLSIEGDEGVKLLLLTLCLSPKASLLPDKGTVFLKTLRLYILFLLRRLRHPAGKGKRKKER